MRNLFSDKFRSTSIERESERFKVTSVRPHAYLHLHIPYLSGNGVSPLMSSFPMHYAGRTSELQIYSASPEVSLNRIQNSRCNLYKDKIVSSTWIHSSEYDVIFTNFCMQIIWQYVKFLANLLRNILRRSRWLHWRTDRWFKHWGFVYRHVTLGKLKVVIPMLYNYYTKTWHSRTIKLVYIYVWWEMKKVSS